MACLSRDPPRTDVVSAVHEAPLVMLLDTLRSRRNIAWRDKVFAVEQGSSLAVRLCFVVATIGRPHLGRWRLRSPMFGIP
jgi:hypothetical protein